MVPALLVSRVQHKCTGQGIDSCLWSRYLLFSTYFDARLGYQSVSKKSTNHVHGCNLVGNNHSPLCRSLVIVES
jgi:hypothetical protein